MSETRTVKKVIEDGRAHLGSGDVDAAENAKYNAEIALSMSAATVSEWCDALKLQACAMEKMALEEVDDDSAWELARNLWKNMMTKHESLCAVGKEGLERCMRVEREKNGLA